MALIQNDKTCKKKKKGAIQVLTEFINDQGHILFLNIPTSN